MDWLKLVLDRFFGLIAGLIPGSAVLIVIGTHHPAWAGYVRDISYLGYRTKVALVVIAALFSGWTVLAIYNSLVGGIQGIFRAKMEKSLMERKDPELPPWRNLVWRSLMKKYLGDGAPADVDFIADDFHQKLLQGATAFPFPLQQQEIDRVNKLRLDSRTADLQWAAWWNNLHSDLLYKKDPLTMTMYTIEANLQAASLVLLVSMRSTPELYRWWVVAPCLYWVLLRILQEWNAWRNQLDPWSSFQQQTGYLRQLVSGQAAKDA